MPRNDVDVESPRPLELSFAPFIKEDEPSVATHLSDTDTDFEPWSHASVRYVRPLRKLALVAIVATLLGVAAGFGARHREESSSSKSMTNPVSGDTPSMESVVAGEEGHRAGASTSTQYIFNPYPQTTQTTTPVFSLTASQPSGTYQNDNKDTSSPRVSDDSYPDAGGYSSRVEDPSTGAVTGVITSQTATPTADPNQATTPPFNGVVGLPATQTVEWPGLVGLPGDQAKKIIEDEGKGYTVIIVPRDGIVTKDWRQDRVFIVVNEEGYVEEVPRPGR